MFVSSQSRFAGATDAAFKKLVSTELNLRHDRDGWGGVSETWGPVTVNAGPPLTYTVQVPGTPSVRFAKGMKVRLKTARTGTTWQYYYLIGVTDSGATPTILLTGGSDFALQASDVISSIWISRETCPQGFPDWFNWSASWGHAGAGHMQFTPSVCNVTRFKIDGREVRCRVMAIGTTAGTGEGDLDFTAPVTSANLGRDQHTSGIWTDDGSGSGGGDVDVIAATANAQMYKQNGATWGIGALRGGNGVFVYEY